jgi:3-oxoacyl-[acyl-carrier-protein] synthase III
MNQLTISLTDVSSYLPGEPVGADYYVQFADSDDLAANLMFRAPKFRHHVGSDETVIDMVERAAVIMMAAFAHAGDFAGAAAVRWGGRS